MKKLFIYATIVFGLVAIVFMVENLISSGLNKIWRESSFADFANGQFENTVLEDINGGQIRLPHPMQRVQHDSLISEQPRFIEYDSDGNFYATWVEQPDKNVFIQKYN